MDSYLHVEALLQAGEGKRPPSGARDAVSTLCRRVFMAEQVDLRRGEQAEVVLVTLFVLTQAVRSYIRDEGLHPAQAFAEARRDVMTAVYDTQSAVRADRDRGGASRRRSR